MNDFLLGSAFVYIRAGDSFGGAWSEAQKLVAAGGAGGDEFGRSVAVQNDVIAIGAWLQNNVRGIGAGVSVADTGSKKLYILILHIFISGAVYIRERPGEPTGQPTTFPSSRPSAIPTGEPSGIPSNSPSAAPTFG